MRELTTAELSVEENMDETWVPAWREAVRDVYARVLPRLLGRSHIIKINLRNVLRRNEIGDRIKV
jgi:hypothetical protein